MKRKTIEKEILESLILVCTLCAITIFIILVTQYKTSSVYKLALYIGIISFVFIWAVHKIVLLTRAKEEKEIVLINNVENISDDFYYIDNIANEVFTVNEKSTDYEKYWQHQSKELFLYILLLNQPINKNVDYKLILSKLDQYETIEKKNVTLLEDSYLISKTDNFYLLRLNYNLVNLDGHLHWNSIVNNFKINIEKRIDKID